MHLEPRQPFDFAHTLRFILSPPPLKNGRVFPPLVDHLVEGEYRRAVSLAGKPVLYGVAEEGCGLSVRILAGASDAATLEVIRDIVARQFSIALDLAPFYGLAGGDPVLARLAERFRGMRIPQAASVFETIVSAILEQQVNLSFAHQVKRALVEKYGEALEFEGRTYHAFPAPEALAIRTPRELRRIQISGPKARYIIAASRLALDGTIVLEGLRALEPPLALEKLQTLKGVGAWTAQYAGLRALGHLDSLPAADVGLQEAIRRFYGLRKRPSATRVEKLGRAWAGWRSYATFYLWMTFWESPAWREEVIAEIREAKRRKSR